MSFRQIKQWVERDPTEEECQALTGILANPWLRLLWVLTSWPRRHFFKLMGFLGFILILVTLLATGVFGPV